MKELTKLINGDVAVLPELEEYQVSADVSGVNYHCNSYGKIVSANRLT